MKYILKVIKNIVDFLLIRVLHMDLSEKQMEGILQFCKFGIVGLSNTVISYIIYVVVLLTIEMLGILENLDYLVAQIIAFVLSVLWSFYWNNKYVFSHESDAERNIFRALLKTYVSYAFTGLFLNSILAVISVQILGINKLVVPIINLLISVPINFILNKFWAFR